MLRSGDMLSVVQHAGRSTVLCWVALASLLISVETAFAGDFDPEPIAALPAVPELVAEPDCFFRSEVALVFPHVNSLLRAPVILGNGTLVPVSLQSGKLNPTVSPLFQVGAFRFGPGYGELALTYRFLVSDGSQDLSEESLGFARVRSRLAMNTFDLDYIKTDCPLIGNVRLDWYMGFRLQVVFFDTQAERGFVRQTANNDFFGVGPRVGFKLARPLLLFGDNAGREPALSLFSRFESAAVVGYDTSQAFSAIFAAGSPQPGSPVMGINSQQATNGSPSIAVQAGMTVVLPVLPALRWQAGYQFEQWYQLGVIGSSRGDVYSHGVFFGGQWLF